MKFTRHQQDALDKTGAWLNNLSAKQVFKLFGYAGTGKTTLAKYLVEGASGRWLFAAYTGKAAHVLRQKGCRDASTIHSLIYRPAGESKKRELDALDYKIAKCRQDIEAIKFDARALAESQLEQHLLKLTRLRDRVAEDNEPQFALWANSPLSEYEVRGIVVDEVSMVDRKLASDLESFGKKVLVLGDPAQLPPVGGGGHYTNSRPDVMLTEVHRQAEESGVLRLATLIRSGKSYHGLTLPSDVELMSEEAWWGAAEESERYRYRPEDFPQVLCGTNKTRRTLNEHARALIGFHGRLPEPKDRLVCLKNNRSSGVYNGSQWVVQSAQTDDVDVMDLELRDAEGEGEERFLTAWTHRFVGRGAELEQMAFHDRREHDSFDFAYAMTVHKAQGSQWSEVVVYDQSRYFRKDARRWLYTAVTRAAERLTILN